MKIRLLLLFIFLPLFLFSQNRKGQFFISDFTQEHDLFVAFTSDFKDESQNADFTQIVSTYKINFKKGTSISDEKIVEMKNAAISLKNETGAIENLPFIFKIEFENQTNTRILELANLLEKFSVVRYCNIVSKKPILPPTDIAPTTPSYELNQTYIQSNPGVNMQYAWDLGFNGQGIKMRDVEYGFNANHEELNSVNVSIASGMTISSSATLDYTEHGTAVIGVLYADKGTYGVSGLAHGATELKFFPEWQQSGYDRVFAVSQAINNSIAGDVIVYEMQSDGPTSSIYDYVPAEYDQVVWDLTKAATDSGIIIVAAAANGDQNLDDLLYSSYMSRGNSGAILVGAGTSNLNHDKIYYSNYGSRVDLQAWGNNVQSIGKLSSLSYFQINNDINQSYVSFEGTSSATPMVAACSVVLQSYYYSLHTSYMSPINMRSLLINTGISQGSGGHIGPIPNMQTAMQTIYNAYLSAESFSNEMQIIVFPNPVENEINFKINTSLQLENATLEIINSLGQIVYKNKFNQNIPVDVSSFSAGFYFVKISNEEFVCRKKIYKK